MKMVLKELLEDISSVPEQGEPRVEEGANLNGRKKIRFLVDGEEMIVLLNGNASAEALYEMLPLELTFEDFNHTEKIIRGSRQKAMKKLPLFRLFCSRFSLFFFSILSDLNISVKGNFTSIHKDLCLI